MRNETEHEFLKAEAVRMALEIVRNSPLTVTACYTGERPTDEELELFETDAADIINDATEEQLDTVYEEVLEHDGTLPVAPSTLLCWLADRADTGHKGIRAETINLETDR